MTQTAHFVTHNTLRITAAALFVGFSVAGCSIGHITTGIESPPVITEAANAHLVPAYNDQDRLLMDILVWKYAE